MKNKEIYTCSKCRTKTDLFFCPNCGTIINYPSFVGDNESRKHALSEFTRSVVDEAKKQKIDITKRVETSNVRNAFYRKYYEQIAYLQRLCQNTITKNYFANSGVNMFDQMNAFAEKCEMGKCQIAVVGTVKAGKSMFINALIGKEIASSYPTPETASLTKFRKSAGGDYVKISFYTSHEWNELWKSAENASVNAVQSDDEKEDFLSLYKELNAERFKHQFLGKNDLEIQCQSLAELKEIIDRYTSARHAEHFFAKEVEVGLSDFFAPSNVVVVDTPGLDDPVPYRTNITRDYLHNANVVLLCIRSNRSELPSTELTQLSYIFAELRHKKDRIITIGTQIDEPKNMLSYWKKYTLPEYLKYLKRKSLYGSIELALSHVFPASAWYYLLVKKVSENSGIFKAESEEDKKTRDDIEEVINRYFKGKSIDELVEEFNGDKIAAFDAYKTPREIFAEKQEDLLRMTQIPRIRQLILDGPIRNANDIIMSDIKSLYLELCEEIAKLSSDVASYRKKTIDVSKSNDVLSRIKELERSIVEGKKAQREQAELLSGLTHELEQVSQQTINNLKD